MVNANDNAIKPNAGGHHLTEELWCQTIVERDGGLASGPYMERELDVMSGR